MSSAIDAVFQMARDLGLPKPTDEQAAVAAHPPTVMVEGTGTAAPLLVVAGAGSGKTETLSLRALFMTTYYGIAPESILGLTFTRKAAGELEHRLRVRLNAWQKLTGEGQVVTALAGAPEGSTYDAFALSVVREFGAEIGIDSQAGRLGEAAAWQLMSEIVSQWQSDLPGATSLSDTVDEALSLRQDIANQALSMEQARRRLEGFCGHFELLVREKQQLKANGTVGASRQKAWEAADARVALLDIIEEFESQKARLGLMDYADYLAAAIRIIEDVPRVRTVLRDRYQVVFLDEFQDTSVAQMRFLSGLFGDHPVTAVGDPNQAIYGWRGASAASLQDFHRYFKSHEKAATTLSLSVAWRNDKVILDVANQIAEPLKNTAPWSLDSKPAGTPLSTSQSVSLPQLLASPKARLGTVTVKYRQSAEQCTTDVVNFMTSVRKDADFPPTCAVLARRAASLPALVQSLREAGVPAQLASGDALLHHPAIIDLRSALEICWDVGKSSSLLRLLANLDLGAADLLVLGKLARSLSSAASGETEQVTLLLEAVESIDDRSRPAGLSEAAFLRVRSLAGKLRDIRRAAGRSLADQVDHARWVLGLDADALADPTSKGVPDALDQLVQIADEYEQGLDRASMPAFLAWLDVAERQEQGIRVPSVHTDPLAVQVMTIHAAKGLEWDAVAVVEMADTRFPLSRRRLVASETAPDFEPWPKAAPQWGWWSNPGSLPFPLRSDRDHLPPADIWDPEETIKNMEQVFRQDMGDYFELEERKLAYVAFTRARSSLLLSGAWHETGTTTIRRPSVFLTDAASVPDVLVESSPGPTAAQVFEMNQATAGALFPVEPSRNRRQAEQVAARIAEASDDLIRRAKERNLTPRELEDSLRRSVLAGVADRDLAALAEGLLRKRDEDELQAALSRDQDADQILAAVAASRDLSVTELAAFAADPDATAARMVRPVPVMPGRASLVGTAFHQWLERHLRRLAASDEEPESAQVDTLSGMLPEDREQLRLLQHSFVSSKHFVGWEAVALEAPFWLPSATPPVRGRIDAVLRDPEGKLWLIDWKTRSRIPERLTDAETKAFTVQLRIYRDAWADRKDSAEGALNAALVFVAPDGVRMVKLDELEQM